MLEEILEASELQNREARFSRPPAGPYIVWFDDVESDGPDGGPSMIFTHDVSLELYEPERNPAAVKRLEEALSAAGVHWTKTGRVWIQSEQMYETVYNFSYIEK